MCRHGYFEVQINHHGREFVNGVYTYLHDLTGVDQLYNLSIPFAIKRSCGEAKQNDKECLGKSTGSHPVEWLHIFEGVLFAHCVS